MKKRTLFLGTLIGAHVIGFLLYVNFNTTYQKNTNIQNASRVKSAPSTTPTPMSKPTQFITSKVTPTSTPIPTQEPTQAPLINTPTPNTIQPLFTPTPLPDSSAPTIKISGTGDGMTVTNSKFCYMVEVFDNAGNLVSRNRLDGGVWSEWGRTSAQYNPCFENVSNGSHTFTVEAKDPTGNTSTQSRTVIVNTTASTTTNPIQAN